MSVPARVVPDVGNDVFDQRPLEIGGFRMTGRTARPVGRPTKKGWVAAMQLAVAAHESSPYWVGDLMAYLENREDWKEASDQMVHLTGYAQHTLHNLAYVARHVEEPERALAPSIGHAAVVAKLTRPEQTELLSRARTEHLSVHEFRREVRAHSRRQVIEGQAVLRGQYRVLYADYPWTYRTTQPSASSAQAHYPGMTVAEGMALPVAAHAMTDAVLFFWVTAPMLCFATDPAQGPDWFRIITAWGFEPKTGAVWDKVQHVFGNYVSVRHEHLIIATRGSCLPDRPTPMPDSVVTIRRDGEHSEKPEEFRQLIEKLYDGPYLELFGRERVEGWDVFGNDAALWHEQVSA